jgi:4-amino-4-deoxy-L-arabinose transferase-like glycosyltransferase
MKKIFPIIILTIISALLIFYRFVNIPTNLAFDEVEFAKLALSLQNKPYAPYSTLATGHSTLYFYILSASLKLFGINTFALRLPAAIFGILSVLIFYFIIKKINKDSLFPFLLAVIFLTSRWFLNFSRFSFEATFLLFLELTAIYFFIKHKVSNRWLILSGIFAGLAYNSYTPGRIFFLLPLVFLFFQLINPNIRNKLIKNLFLFLIPFIIVITPLTSYFIHNQDSRIDKLFFWKNHEMTINEKINGTAENVKSITLMFFSKGDLNGKHNYPGKPALNPILAILFIVGLIMAIKNWKNAYNLFAISYLLLSIFPSLAIYPWENPNMLRTFTVIPSVVYFIGLAIFEIMKKIKQKYLWLLLIIITLSCFYELRTYFKYQSIVFNDSFEIKWPLDQAIKLKDPYEKFH